MIRIFLFGALAISTFFSKAYLNTKVSKISSKANSNAVLACSCTPDYAGEDKVVCFQTPAQGVQIGCTLAPSDPECAALCFEWTPAPGLSPADKLKSDPVVTPSTTTTYTVSVKNMATGDNVGSYNVTVFVATLDLILYKPFLTAGNTLTPVNPGTGAQTFVNLDNDDQDGYFDNDPQESTTVGVNTAFGDDELIRAELRVSPATLPSNLARLVALSGAANIKVWQNNTKLGAEYALNTDVALSPDPGGTYLTKDLWIEGILPHTVQKGTVLKMTYQGVDCVTPVPVTIIGVEQMTWRGMNNSASDGNVLDADPNYVAPSPLPSTWPGAVRVFPDARMPQTTVPLNKVFLDVTLSVAPAEQIDLYVRSFDVDDPTNNAAAGVSDPNYLNFVDPNDVAGAPAGDYSGTGGTVTYTPDEDNRTGNPKSGQFTGQVGNSTKLVFIAGVSTATLEFANISMHPGDNYRAVANGDKDFLENLENLDARDFHAIVDKYVTLPGPNPLEIQFPLKYASPVLTIWRFLHVEKDAMDKPRLVSGDSSDFNNILLEDFWGFIPNSSNGIVGLERSTMDLRRNYDSDTPDIIDNSALTSSPVPCVGVGRFQGGEVKVWNGNTGNTNTAVIQSNSEDIIQLSTPLDLTGAKCTFQSLGTMVNYIGTATLKMNPVKTGTPPSSFFYTWELQNINIAPPGATLDSFVNGLFKINLAANQKIIGATHSNLSLETNGFNLKVEIRDDDASASVMLPRNPSLTYTNAAYDDTYLVVREVYIPAPSDVSVWDANLENLAIDNDFVKLNSTSQSTSVESPFFWCVHVFSAWQGNSYLDNDGNIYTPGDPTCQAHPSSGGIWGVEQSPLAGWTLAMPHNIDMVAGGDYSYIFFETIREFPTFTEENTVAHEIGHQFGLGHGDSMTDGGAIPEYTSSTGMGLMSQTGVFNFLIPRHQNLIRSRKNSPGH